MVNDYSILSKYYDKLIYDQDYQKWVDYVVNVVQTNAVNKKGVDVACGTGIFTRALKKSGFDVIGVDNSQDMLKKAINLTAKENLSITYLKQNMKSLKVFERVGFITCINDGLNYVDSVGFEKAIKSFYKNLVKGGLLLFDISSKYKLETILGNNMYGDNGEDLSYVWFNTLSENSVDISITFFEKTKGGYARYDETQTQYIYSLDFVKDCLKNNGFDLLSVKGELGEDLKETSLRQIFIAIKK